MKGSALVTFCVTQTRIHVVHKHCLGSSCLLQRYRGEGFLGLARLISSPLLPIINDFPLLEQNNKNQGKRAKGKGFAIVKLEESILPEGHFCKSSSKKTSAAAAFQHLLPPRRHRHRHPPSPSSSSTRPPRTQRPHEPKESVESNRRPVSLLPGT